MGVVLSFVSILFVVIGGLFDAGGKIFFASYIAVVRCQTFFAVGISPRQIIRVGPGLKDVNHVLTL